MHLPALRELLHQGLAHHQELFHFRAGQVDSMAMVPARQVERDLQQRSAKATMNIDGLVRNVSVLLSVRQINGRSHTDVGKRPRQFNNDIRI